MEISTTSSYGNTALGAYINQYDKEISTSLERLASGLRVRTPSDDPGAYFRSQTLNRRADRSLTVSRDIEDHLSRVKSAEEYLGTVSTMLGDMLSLANEAKDETNATLRESLGKEYDEKVTALQEFIDGARYDGNLLLAGAYDSSAGGSAVSAQVDEEIDDTYSYEILDTTVTAATGLNLSGFDDAETDWLASQANAESYVTALEDADSGITRVNRNLNRIATHKTILEGAQSNLSNKAANYQAASSALAGVDDAAESTKLSALQIRQQAAASFLAQSNVVSNGVIGMLTGFTSRA